METPLAEQDVQFATQVVDPVSLKRSAARRAPNVEVLAVVKAPGNPYPDRVSVGRARNCDVVMRDPSVSKLHAHFRVGGPKLELVDIDSQNGTRVNGRALAPHQPAAGLDRRHHPLRQRQLQAGRRRRALRPPALAREGGCSEPAFQGEVGGGEIRGVRKKPDTPEFVGEKARRKIPT